MQLSLAVSTAAGIGSLVLAAVASWSSLLLVVRGRVIPGWGVSAVLLVVSLFLQWALTRVGHLSDASKFLRKRAEWARLGSSLLIVTAALGTTWGVVDDLTSNVRYRVLRPAGPEGCTAVVREASFLMAGNGEVYAVGRTGLALGESGSWMVDDGYRPIDAGTYELSWGQEGGHLQISGTSADPVLHGGSTDINCG
ncbi:hypothetical protein [Streptomyces sp. enrichment culture]|uniref:hypothetical protein n=1 Tax=Streptomyces sp. enrichment culture TaxID=1795815 RepID=UPI003F5522A0